jgi:hypothetical protein
MKNRLKKIWYLFKIAFLQSEYLTYYPNEPRKSRFRVFRDLLRIYFKFNEISKVYFIRGGDLINSQWCEVSYTGVRNLRDKLQSDKSNDQIKILSDKQLFYEKCVQNNVRTPRNYGTIENGRIHWVNEPDVDAWIMIKDKTGEKGANVYKVKYLGNNEVLENGNRFNLKGHYPTSDSYIIQEVILQHETMNSLNPSCVNTLRVISTLKNGGTIHVAMLKVGGMGNIYDNWHNKGIITKVDPKTWKVDQYGYYKFSKYDKVTSGKVAVLPSNNIELGSVQIPYSKEIENLVFQAHAMLPDIHSIGWDVAIGANGPILIEGNHNWGFLDLIQVFYGTHIITEIFDVPMSELKQSTICFN